LLADFGGFNGTIFMISSFLLTHLYTSHLFYYTLVRELFYFDLNRLSPAANDKNIKKKNSDGYLDDLHDEDLIKIINRVLSYIRFKMPINILLAWSCCKKPPYLSKFAYF
jgi:hypothetical protein